MGRNLGKEEVKAAELAVSHCFDVAGVRRIRAK